MLVPGGEATLSSTIDIFMEVTTDKMAMNLKGSPQQPSTVSHMLLIMLHVYICLYVGCFGESASRYIRMPEK